MKKIILLFSFFLFLSHFSFAQQNWDSDGNTLTGNGLLGTKSNHDLGIITNDITRSTFTKAGDYGYGIMAPRATNELFYCPSNTSTGIGMVITKENCPAMAIQPFDPNINDVIGEGKIGPPPPVEASIKIPFSFLTGHKTILAFPLYSTAKPIFWVRTEHPASGISSFGGQEEYDTKFIVMPDGSVGINLADPRAALDVRGSQAPNHPAAIIGSRAMGTHVVTGNGLVQYHTQQVHFVPNLTADGYNTITQGGDQGMFFSDGQGTEGANLDGAFILAPWAQNADLTTVGGMRMDKNGNTEFHGTVRTTQLNVDIKWWADFVFEPEYKLRPLKEVEQFIAENGHLPDVPSAETLKETGVDVAEMQALQQQKIEELTLYIIELRKELDNLKTELDTNPSH